MVSLFSTARYTLPSCMKIVGQQGRMRWIPDPVTIFHYICHVTAHFSRMYTTLTGVYGSSLPLPVHRPPSSLLCSPFSVLSAQCSVLGPLAVIISLAFVSPRLFQLSFNSFNNCAKSCALNTWLPFSQQ